MNVATTSKHSYAIRPNGQPGSMTAVMRAVTEVTGPRVLRVGLVQGGRVLDDRILKERTTVTVGTSEKATFVVTTEGLGPLVRLFERVGDDYYLHVLAGMTGRIALPSGTDAGLMDVAHLRESARDGRVRLPEDARGKVTLGDTTFLFQFVPPPIPASRPQLPLAIKAGLASQVDWNLTILVAFSFLAHFGVIGGMYADWMDPVVSTGATAGGVVDMLQHLPSLPIEIPQAAATDPSTAPATTPEASHPATPAPAAHRPQAVGTPAHQPKPMSPADAAALAAAADAIGVSALIVLHTGGVAVQAVMESEIPPVDLGPAAGSVRGATASAGNGLRFGTGGQPIEPGSTGRTLAELAKVHGDGKSETAGPIVDKGGPAGVVSIAPPVGPGEDLPGAAAVVAGLRAGFRRCYNAGLNLDPAMSGKVMLTAKIATNGEVASTDASDNVGLSGTVVQCLLTKLGTAQFEHVRMPTSLKIPVGFIPQGK